MNCPQCGAPLDEGAKFCGSCGTAIVTAAQQPTPATYIPPPQPPAGSAPSYPFTPPPAPSYSGVPPYEDKASGLAIAALVCGIVSFCCGCIGALPAWICGGIALGQISSGQASPKGKGLAWAGIILGILGVIINAIIGFMSGMFNAISNS